MKKLINCICVLVVSLGITSCATIVAGGHPSVTIDGDVTEPVTISTEYKTYKDVTLPAVVKVKRHDIDGQRIKIESANYNFRDIVLEKTINSWTFGNIILGGLIGWGIDAITNCVSKPQITHFFIDGKKKEDQ